MKDLFLMRHGQAENGSRTVSDHLRALTPRGRTECIRQGRRVHPENDHRLIASSAIRTIQTAGLIAEVWAESGLIHTPTIEIEERGYLAEPDVWMHLASCSDERFQGLWCIGHNPGISALVTVLTGEYMGLTTADLVHLKLNINRWSDIHSNCGAVAARYAPEGA